MSDVFGVSREIVDRGFDYYLWGRVVSCNETEIENEYEAEVLGSKDNIYNVDLDTEDLFESFCDCKYFEREGTPCKHIMAVFFEVSESKTEDMESDEDEEDDLNYTFSGKAEVENAYEAEHAKFARVAKVADYAKYARHILDNPSDCYENEEYDPEYERTKDRMKVKNSTKRNREYRLQYDEPAFEIGKCVSIEDFVRSNDYALDDEYELEYPIDGCDETGKYAGKDKFAYKDIRKYVDSLDEDAVRECLADILETIENLGLKFRI